MEISGKTDGWVALGLSSDDKMGGDGAIVCKLKSSALNRDLEALSMAMTVPYNRPTARPVNDISLLDYRAQDGHIYCKIKKNISDDPQSSRSGVDLTNNWFQFYAKGNIDRNGIMLKHSRTPPTSLDTISMLRAYHVDSVEYKQLSSSAMSATYPRSWLTSSSFMALLSLLASHLYFSSPIAA